MSALDFSHFKKIKQDKKCATLLHPDGHEIKVYVSGLSPSLQKKLSELPLYQADPEDPVQTLDPKSPAQINEDNPVVDPAHAEPAAPEAQQAAEPAAMAPASKPAVPATSVPPAGAEASQAMVAKSPATNVAPSTASNPPAQSDAPPEKTAEQEADEKTKDDLLFGQDLSNKHITPKTYGDLFADKSTLGKVGTLFGLMLSGVGSGLTHQPNAVLKMMDQQIQNDLEAQKTNEGNKQSWARISMDQTKNQITNELLGAQAFKTMTEAEQQQFINNNQGVVNKIGSLGAINKMYMTTIQDGQNTIDKLPPGPGRDRAQALQNTRTQQILEQIKKNNLEAVLEKRKMMSSLPNRVQGQENNLPPKGEAEIGKQYDVYDRNKYLEMAAKGDSVGERTALSSGAIKPSDQKGIEKEADDLAAVRAQRTEWGKTFYKLRDLKLAGEVPGAGAIGNVASGVGGFIGSILGPLGIAGGAGAGKVAGEAIGSGIRSAFERERNAYYDQLIAGFPNAWSDERKKATADSMLPKWQDLGDEKRLSSIFNNGLAHWARTPEEQGSEGLKKYKLYVNAPKYTYQPKKKEQP